MHAEFLTVIEQLCLVFSDVKQFIHPIFGACYTFNGMSPSKYKSARAGPLYGKYASVSVFFHTTSKCIECNLTGLRLLLKSNQSDYVKGTESSGVRVVVHGQGEEPFPDAFGYNAASGYTTSFGVQFVRNSTVVECQKIDC